MRPESSCSGRVEELPELVITASGEGRVGKGDQSASQHWFLLRRAATAAKKPPPSSPVQHGETGLPLALSRRTVGETLLFKCSPKTGKNPPEPALTASAAAYYRTLGAEDAKEKKIKENHTKENKPIIHVDSKAEQGW